MDTLKHAREIMKAASKGIGEPAVRLNPDHILVNDKDPTILSMRMDHLIEMVDEILRQYDQNDIMMTVGQLEMRAAKLTGEHPGTTGKQSDD